MLVNKKIKKCIINVIKFFANNKNKIKWINNKAYIKSNYIKDAENVIKVNCKNNFKNILIICPHADDELIGCYKFLNENKDNVKIFYCGFTGNNNDINNAKTRYSEFKRFCKTQKINYYISSKNIKSDLLEVVKKYRPDLILIPTCIDWHWQHRECNYICYEVLQNLNIDPYICWYQISVPIPDCFFNLAVVLSQNDQNDKWEIFNYVYESQRHMPVFRYKIAENITGFKVNQFSAEAFSIQTFIKWEALITYIKEQIDQQRLNDLECDINNLKDIWCKSNQIGEKLKNNLGENYE